MTKRKNRQKKSTLYPGQLTSVILLLAVGIFLSGKVLLGCDNSKSEIPPIETESPDAIALQKVVTNPALEEHIVHYKGFTVSFNPRLHIPNWVAWELTRDETGGEEPRTDKFLCDESVPGCPETWDYSYSGYDRGHMAPAGDMKWDSKAMAETFFMTNIAPQKPELNRETWMRLENKCRDRAKADSAVIIICGPVLTDPINEYIGDNRVAVPKRYFKVILSPFRTDPVAIGFIMPNDAVKGGMQPCAVSVDEVEKATGHNFFTALGANEASIESKFNFDRWSKGK